MLLRADRGFGAARRTAATLALLLLSGIAATSAAGDASEPPAPLVTGEPIEGQVLVASSSDPTVQPDLYRWQRCDPDEAVCDGAGGHADPEWADIAGATGHDLTEYTLTGADVGHHVRVVAKYTSLGSKFAASAPVGPIKPAPSPPSPPPPPPAFLFEPPLPPPIAHQTANLDPLNGVIFVNEPGPGGFRQVTEPEQIPLGSKVNAGQGHVDVYTARNERGVIQVAEFWAGAFKLTQTPGDHVVTKLKLIGGPGARSADGRAARKASRGRSGRRLWGRGRCRCRTGGRHSSGTVRGTWWLTVETPNGTLTKVKQGRVEVHDFALGETVVVGAGEHYLARAGS